MCESDFQGGTTSPACKYCLAAPCHRICHNTPLHHKACPQVVIASGVYPAIFSMVWKQSLTATNISLEAIVITNLQFGFDIFINVNEIKLVLQDICKKADQVWTAGVLPGGHRNTSWVNGVEEGKDKVDVRWSKIIWFRLWKGGGHGFSHSTSLLRKNQAARFLVHNYLIFVRRRGRYPWQTNSVMQK